MTAKKAAKPGVKTAAAADAADANEKKASKARATQAAEVESTVAEAAAEPKKRGRKPKAATAASPAAAPKAAAKASFDEDDVADIEADLEGEPVEGSEAEVEDAGSDKPKAKPLRMKVSRAKERALMREFGIDETALSEEEVAKRRQELKTLIKMGKTRGFLTHQEINDHLPEKLVEAEILEAIISMLNDMGVAVYEQAPDAATLLISGSAQTQATEEEAEEAAEAALSTVDSEFGRTTDPVRMYMREMGTVELLTREGEIEIAKRIEG
ncbi:RNA polymerase sigma factor region1.1 domain-containing protein, partial [Aquabacterium sp.]